MPGSQTLGNILVVDDEPNNTDLLKKRLERLDYRVDTAHSGCDALKLLHQADYDCVLLDVMMPEMDGWAVLETIRSTPAWGDLPVIMLTALASRNDTLRAFADGADDYVTKPFEFSILLARLRTQLAKRMAQCQLEKLNAALKTEVEERTGSLQKSEALLSSIVENLSAVVGRVRVLDDGSVALDYLTGSVSTVLQASPDQCLAKPDVLWQRLDEGEQNKLAENFQKAREGSGSLIHDVRFKDEEGMDRWVHLGAHFRDEECLTLDGILLDITEQKHLETQLLHTQKLEAVGQLASGIAHEINSPAQYAKDNIGFMKECFGDIMPLLKSQSELLELARNRRLTEAEIAKIDEVRERSDLEFVLSELPDAIDQGLDGIERISNIVQAMKGFTHPGGEDPESCDLNKLIEDTVVIARNEWKYVAEMDLELDASLPFISCFPGELGQVILNLVVNAAHAIDEDRAVEGELGRIGVSTRFFEEETCVEIRISDSGPGVPDTLKHRIFEPFFTTKVVGKGTGQGLAIAHSVIVDKHKGSLSLDDNTGVGATFVIRLPQENE